MLRNTLKLFVTKLCSTLVFLFITSACDKTEISPEENPSPFGSWEVKAISISDRLTNIDSFPNNASYSNISIIIPDTTRGTIDGHTFMNTIWIGYEILENQEIIFKSYAGTRFSEDPWGRAFKHHIMFNVMRFNITNSELQFIDSLDNTVIMFEKYLIVN